MPRISLYKPEKSKDYRFFDRNISEQFTVGGTDLYVHKYLGVSDQGPTQSLSQPQYNKLDPTNIQDLLFLENRDRKYDPNIYRVRGHYNVQNLDFDLSQFGLFLNNDVIFVTVHYNDMINVIGRKLMVGDVLEMPHLTDYHPLNDKIPTSLRRYYQITDSNYASEGFSSTWYPHLWRIKCEPLVDSQEFSNILDKPTDQENFLGDWDKTKTYPPGYVVSYGGKNYIATTNVPVGTPCTNTSYWQLDTTDSIKDIIGRYNKNIQINDALIAEAARIVPAAGYDRSQLYLAPTDTNNKPALPISRIQWKSGPNPAITTLDMINSEPLLRVTAAALSSINGMEGLQQAIKAFINMELELLELPAEKLDTGAGSVENDLVLAAKALGDIIAPYGTVDNMYARADEDPSSATFIRTRLVDRNIMDFRADADPRFTFTEPSTPRGFGYTTGYMVGDGSAPNGVTAEAGIVFPQSPTVGTYFLRTDYLPQQLFRFDGNLWIKISENIRTGVGFGGDSQNQKSSFINNTNVTTLSDGSTIPEQQSLSSILRITPD